jgi:hypothetical protein
MMAIMLKNFPWDKVNEHVQTEITLAAMVLDAYWGAAL